MVVMFMMRNDDGQADALKVMTLTRFGFKFKGVGH